MIEVRLTRNAVPTGSPFELPRYGSVNDLHVAFDRGTGDVYIEYTHDGEVVAKRTAPKDANDVGFEFEDERGFKILRSFWTKDGKRLRDSDKDPDEGPRKANDVHLVLPRDGKITSAYWTNNGEKIERGDVTLGQLQANDLHFGNPDHFPFNKKKGEVRSSLPRHDAAAFAGAFHLQASAAARFAEVVEGCLARVEPVHGEERPDCGCRDEKVQVSIRAMLGVSFRVEAGKTLRIASILPGSPAETTGLQPDDVLVQAGNASAAGSTAIGGAMAALRTADQVLLKIERKGKALQLQFSPRFYVLPYYCFASGIEFNKAYDKNCNCTVEENGFLCATLYIYDGEGPNGGVLYRKRCVSKSPDFDSDVRFGSDCGVHEYF